MGRAQWTARGERRSGTGRLHTCGDGALAEEVMSIHIVMRDTTENLRPPNCGGRDTGDAIRTMDRQSEGHPDSVQRRS